MCEKGLFCLGIFWVGVFAIEKPPKTRLWGRLGTASECLGAVMKRLGGDLCPPSPQDGPGRSPGGPRSAVLAPPNDPKILSLDPQDDLRRPQDNSKTAQDGPKTLPRSSEESQRGQFRACGARF